MSEVEGYIEGAPAERQEVLHRLREVCREVLAGYEERVEYGMPVYGPPGADAEVAFASQSRHIALYLMREDVMDAHRDRLAGLDVGKGCIRFKKPEAVDLALARDLLEATRASSQGSR